MEDVLRRDLKDSGLGLDDRNEPGLERLRPNRAAVKGRALAHNADLEGMEEIGAIRAGIAEECGAALDVGQLRLKDLDDRRVERCPGDTRSASEFFPTRCSFRKVSFR